eukprot:762027-Hanusia_phi.AAC.1
MGTMKLVLLLVLPLERHLLLVHLVLGWRTFHQNLRQMSRRATARADLLEQQSQQEAEAAADESSFLRCSDEKSCTASGRRCARPHARKTPELAGE